MKRLGMLLLSLFALLPLSACTRDDTQYSKQIADNTRKLDEILKNQHDIMNMLRSGARGGGRPQPRRPDPKDVFAVPIAGSPWIGTKDAKVTLVEAFDFA